MSTEIGRFLNEIEQKIGDPEQAVSLKRDFDALRVMIQPTEFHITDVGSSNTYSLTHNSSDDRHRFIVQSIKNLRDSLIERYLPRKVERVHNDEANKAWALLFLHKILAHHDLGDPRIWKNRDYMSIPNSGLRDSIVFFKGGDYIRIEDKYDVRFFNETWNVSISVKNWEGAPDAIKASASISAKEIKEAYKVISSSQALPPLERKRSLQILSDKSTFMDQLHEWGVKLEEEQKQKKED